MGPRTWRPVAGHVARPAFPCMASGVPFQAGNQEWRPETLHLCPRLSHRVPLGKSRFSPGAGRGGKCFCNYGNFFSNKVVCRSGHPEQAKGAGTRGRGYEDLVPQYSVLSLTSALVVGEIPRATGTGTTNWVAWNHSAVVSIPEARSPPPRCWQGRDPSETRRGRILPYGPQLLLVRQESGAPLVA